jgi:hypothetical protein
MSIRIKGHQKMSIKEHLLSRGVNLENTTIYLDEENNVAYFPLYHISKGTLVGYQKYDPSKHRRQRKHENPEDLKYYVESSDKALSFWGAENINLLTDKFIFVTEGIFDAIKIKNMNLPVIATLSNTKPHLKGQFKLLGALMIGILDNEESGNELKNIVDVSFKTPDPYKDLGEMSQDEVNNFIFKTLIELKANNLLV